MQSFYKQNVPDEYREIDLQLELKRFNDRNLSPLFIFKEIFRHIILYYNKYFIV